MSPSPAAASARLALVTNCLGWGTEFSSRRVQTVCGVACSAMITSVPAGARLRSN
jgi:hypothetical protein